MINQIENLTAKMELYRLISLGFHYPKTQMYIEIKGQLFLQAFQNVLEQCKIEINDFDDLEIKKVLMLEGVSFEDFESQYLSDFEIGKASQSVSLCERHYYGKEENKNAATLLEIKEFYKNFELEKASDFEDAEDHLVLELEFMHFLIFKELQAIEAELDPEPYKKCRCDFLERHLIKWIPKFAKLVEKNAKSEFHIFLSKVTDKLVQADYNHCKEELHVV